MGNLPTPAKFVATLLCWSLALQCVRTSGFNEDQLCFTVSIDAPRSLMILKVFVASSRFTRRHRILFCPLPQDTAEEAWITNDMTFCSKYCDSEKGSQMDGNLNTMPDSTEAENLVVTHIRV